MQTCSQPYLHPSRPDILAMGLRNRLGAAAAAGDSRQRKPLTSKVSNMLNRLGGQPESYEKK